MNINVTFENEVKQGLIEFKKHGHIVIFDIVSEIDVAEEIKKRFVQEQIESLLQKLVITKNADNGISKTILKYNQNV